MKIILWILVAILVMAILMMCVRPASAQEEYTYESEINPAELGISWTAVATYTCPKEHFHVAVVNPDETAEIREAELIMLVAHTKMIGFSTTITVVGYQYYKNDELFYYQFDVEKNHYARIDTAPKHSI